MAMAERRPTIATTIIISSRVKPLFLTMIATPRFISRQDSGAEPAVILNSPTSENAGNERRQHFHAETTHGALYTTNIALLMKML
jgi:hypothetical protein